jgi:PAS domain S-box-containing protein
VTSYAAYVTSGVPSGLAGEPARRAAWRREHLTHLDADFQAILLRASHEATIDGVLVVSPDGRMLTWNARFPVLWGIPEEVMRGGSDEEALAAVLGTVADPEGFLQRVHELYAERMPARDEIRLRDGRVLDRYGSPLLGEDGTYHGYAWYVRDVSIERRAAEALEASEARHRSLVQALTSEVWYAAPNGDLVSDMPAWRAVTGQTAEELRGDGWAAGVHPADRERVCARWRESVATGEPLDTEFRIRPVRGTPEEAGAGTRTLAVRGAALERDGAVVEWVGVFVDVTELRAAEAAKDRLAALAAAAAERTRALQEVTAALSGAVTMADVLTVILEQGQAGLGACGSGVALREGDRVHYQVLNGYSADVKAAWSEFGVDESSPVTHVLRHGEPLFVESDHDLIAMFDTEPLRAFLEASGERAFARLPLRTSSGVIGVLGFGFDQPRQFSSEDRSFLLALAGQCAQALERAQLYERERSTARLLQRSLLPDALPTLPGVRLGALCQPASLDVEVGGDWYDALVLPDGRLAVAVGDVMGKGVRAASVMGQVRNALRGLVHADAAPTAVLTWLDAVVAQLGDDEELVTLAYGVLNPSDGTFDWGCAGHPPPLLVGPEKSSYVEGGDSLPLGLGGPRAAGRLVLDADQALLLFSDGLVESRARPLVDGLEELQAHAGNLNVESTADAQEECEAVASAMMDLCRDDDVTLLLLRRDVRGTCARSPVRTAETLLPARATSPSVARRFVTGHLSEWGQRQALDSVLLCVSEVVTNAVVHASSHAELSLRLDRGTLRVEVRDQGTSAIPAARRAPTTEDTHGRGLLLVDAVSDRWGTVEDPGGKVVWFEVAAS